MRSGQILRNLARSAAALAENNIGNSSRPRNFSSSAVNSTGSIPNIKQSSSTSKYSDIESYLHQHKISKPNETYTDFLFNNKITNKGETPENMFHRVAKALADGGINFYGKEQSEKFYSVFYKLISSYQIILSTPVYTNAGRHESKPLTACAVPQINFKNYKKEDLKHLIGSYHIKGMGTGFNLDDADNPVEVLKLLNSIAIDEVKKGLIERPVGNMAILSVDHPQVLDFAAVKRNSEVQEWKFNISIDVSEDFMFSLKENRPYKTKYNNTINPACFLKKFAESAQQTGDPGIIFMHRHENSNKVPHLGKYKSVSPCGEVALLNGEVCQFGYLNLSSFVTNEGINYNEMRYAIRQAIILLDNAIELSLDKIPTQESVSIVSKIRKIGLGICGYSDLLMMLGIPYHSDAAIKLAENLISFINYESKLASLNLAKLRKPFPAFTDHHTLKNLIIGPYIKCPTDTVTSAQWEGLNNEILQHGIRNIATVILPPTGRSSLLGGVSASIEPPFKLACDAKLLKNLNSHCEKSGYKGDLEKVCAIIDKTGSAQDTDLPDDIKQIFLTCLELPFAAHLRTTAAFQKFTDEAISKTVNLPENSSTDDIISIYTQAYYSGLKGVTVYVNNSRLHQPKPLMVDNPVEVSVERSALRL